VETFNAAGVIGVTSDNFEAVIILFNNLEPGVGTASIEEINTNVENAGESMIDGIYIGQVLFTGNGQALYIMDYDSFAFGVGSEPVGGESYPIVGNILSRTGYVFDAEYTIIDGPPEGYSNGKLTLDSESLVWSFEFYDGAYQENYTFPLSQE
jgi:hypothetical protein